MPPLHRTKIKHSGETWRSLQHTLKRAKARAPAALSQRPFDLRQVDLLLPSWEEE